MGLSCNKCNIIRATIIANAPTASTTCISIYTDRHLVFFGTETTVGSQSSQDAMFIRFSDQENIDGTEAYTVTAENTAGTQRLAAGSKIMGAIRGRDSNLCMDRHGIIFNDLCRCTVYFLFQQIGSNCGLIGKNACVEVDGTAYWMSENGFFKYDGQIESMDCLVEDFVYDNLNSTPRDLINVGLNNLFGEVIWFYPSGTSLAINNMVSYNYIESYSRASPKQAIWTTGTLSRTAWADSAVFDKPHATEYDPDGTASDVVGNTDGCSIYYEQETGTDQVKAGGDVTAILAEITSGDFDITQKRKELHQDKPLVCQTLEVTVNF